MGPRSIRCRLLSTALLAAGMVGGSSARAQTSPPPLEGKPLLEDSTPSPPSWNPKWPVPAGYHVERRTNAGLIVAGTIMFSLAYVGVVVPGLIITNDGHWPSRFAAATVPIGGSFVFITQPFPAVQGLVVLDALVQAAGTGMLIGGLVGKRVLVPDASRPSAVQVLPMPLRLGSHGAGLGVAGSF